MFGRRKEPNPEYGVNPEFQEMAYEVLDSMYDFSTIPKVFTTHDFRVNAEEQLNKMGEGTMQVLVNQGLVEPDENRLYKLTPEGIRVGKERYLHSLDNSQKRVA